MRKNGLLKYAAIFFIFILCILVDVVYYNISENKLNNIKNTTFQLNDIKLLSKDIELLQDKIVIYEFSNILSENIIDIYKTQEQLNLKIRNFANNELIEKELIEDMEIKMKMHDVLLDTLAKKVQNHDNIYVILNTKENIAQIFLMIDEIIDEALSELNSEYDYIIGKRKMVLFISAFFYIIFILYSLMLLFRKYIVPLNKISKAINIIIKTDFSKEERLPNIKINNRVGILADDIEKMLEKIHEKTAQFQSQKDITEKALYNFKVLSEIGKKIITQLDVKNIVKVVYENINQLLPITAFGMGINNKKENILDFWKLDAYSKKIQYNYEKINQSNDIAVISFIQSKEIIINDFFKEYQNYIPDIGASISMNKSMIYVPLKTIDNDIGVIYAKYKHVNAYQQHHLDILRNLAIYIAIAIQNAQSFEQIKFQQREILERNEELNQQREEILNINENLENQKIKLEEAFDDIKLLSKIGQEITANLSHDQITETIYRSLDKFMDASTFGVGLYNEAEKRIEFPKLIEKGFYLPFGYDNLDENSLSVQCFMEHKDIYISDLNNEYQKYFNDKPSAKHGELPSSIIYMPLVNKGKKLGVITVQSFKPNAYTENDLNIIRTLATYISTALVNAKAFEEIERKKNELEKANSIVNNSLKAIEKQKEEIEQLANQLEKNYKSIKESEQRMSDIINFVPDPMMVIDKDGIVIAWNKSMEELTNVPAENIVGKGNYEYSLAFYDNRRAMLCDLVLKPTEEIEKKYSNLIKEEDKLIGQAYVPKLDKILWGAARILYNSTGEVIGTIQVSRDVTERIKSIEKIEEANKLLNEQKEEIEKQNQEIIRKSDELHGLVEELQTTAKIIEEYNQELEKLSIVASKTDNAVLIANASGKIEWINEGFERLYGYDYYEFINEFGNTVFNASRNENIEQLFKESVEEKKSAVFVTKNRNAKGEEIWIQTTLTPIFNEDNQLTNIIAIDADISQIKMAEKEIANQNKKIKNSIQYARRIQSAILTPKRFVDRTLAEYFILYKPRDIVSGDFYWIIRRQTKILFAVADCTGHGVPGALMSILGISFLNEIVNKIVESSGVDDLIAGRILDQLRVNIIKSLHQKGKQLEAKDGMDIALCIFDIDHRTIQFAGANNPLYIIRDKQNGLLEEIDDDYLRIIDDQSDNLNLFEIAPDKTPIGFSKNVVQNFKDNSFKIKQGDTIYLFTDGYVDQFGGKLGRKFLAKNFRKTLLDINNYNLKEQELILDNTIESWKNHTKPDGSTYNQIDDILVMGVRF